MCKIGKELKMQAGVVCFIMTSAFTTQAKTPSQMACIVLYGFLPDAQG
jgi:hypothetical protein